jgi:hypothetical protein
MSEPTYIHCAGRISNRPLGQIAGVRVTSTAGHVECLRCANRRVPPAGVLVQFIEPPQFINGKCPERIEK